MAETVVDKAVCKECGVDVRDESVFCYNCGKAVAGPVESDIVVEPVSPEVPEVKDRPPLKSAASLRKSRRAYNRQPVEIVWERSEGPSMVFIAATVILTIAALTLLLLAMYLR